MSANTRRSPRLVSSDQRAENLAWRDKLDVVTPGALHLAGVASTETGSGLYRVLPMRTAADFRQNWSLPLATERGPAGRL